MPAPLRARRLQFSLRFLLLSMAISGISLAIWRHPWEVKSIDANRVTTVTTFRRGWQGQRIKHGWERRRNSNDKLLGEICYTDGQRVCSREYDPPGHLHREETDNVATGRQTTIEEVEPSWELGEPISHTIIRDTNHWVREEWRSPASGRMLESVEWRDRKLVLWNDRPVAEELDRLLGEPYADPVEKASWYFSHPSQPSAAKEYFDAVSDNLGDGRVHHGWLAVSKDDGDAVPAKSVALHIHGGIEGRPDGFVVGIATWCLQYGFENESQYRRPPFIEFLLTDAMSSHCTLRRRFGLVTFVPISPHYLEPDATGVGKVQFPANSAQDRDWNEVIECSPPKHCTHAERAESFFAGTSIQVETKHIPDKPWGRYPLGRFPTPHRHPRRHLLGMFLAYHNYQVEQQGNTLIVRPSPQRTTGPAPGKP